MNREQVTEELGSNISGLVVLNCKLVVGGTLILYFDRGTAPDGARKKPIRLWIDSAWRLCEHDRVIAGSLDDPDQLLPKLRTIIGMVVSDVWLQGIPGDVALKFEKGFIIESFARTTADEQWELRRPDGYRLGLRENLELYEMMQEPDPSWQFAEDESNGEKPI